MAFELLDDEPEDRPRQGKCSAELRVMVPEEIREQVMGVAVLHGVSASEYLRDLIIEHLHGRLSVLRIATKTRR